ncbi:hypothetical protein ABBQ32_004534 [Trebouxia sp. C0010 RCD-2024]
MKAFQETHKARDALQACLDIEDELLNEVADRVQHSLQSSLQAAQVVAAKLQVDDFEREQRHTEVLLRDIGKQHDEVKLLQQQRKTAQAAIKGLSPAARQAESFVREAGTGPHGSGHEAARVQEGIAAIVAEKAQLATRMEAQAQLLAAPDLLQNRPELRWEQAAAGSGPSLGSAKELFVRDRKLTDFRVDPTAAATVVKAEDSEGRVWALKRI